MITTNLKSPPRRHWHDLPTPVATVIILFCLFMIAGLVGRIRSEAPAVVPVQPTPALILVFPTAVPTAAPVQPTVDPAIYQELDALRQRVAELEAAQQAVQPQVAPQVVYQVVNQPAYVEAAPTPVIESAPPPPPVDERTLAIQSHYANERQPAQPAQPVATQSLPAAAATITADVQRYQVSEIWRQEHCIGSGPSEVCTP